MSDEANRNPFRCFDGPFLLGTIVVAIAIVVLGILGRRFDPGTPPRLAIAGVQALLIAGLAIACVLTIRRLDELLLKVHLEGIAISFALSSAFIAGWGMLEKGGAPHIEWGLWAWPVMVGLWGIAAAIRSRRYQ
jgi:hypothetical protein